MVRSSPQSTQGCLDMLSVYDHVKIYLWNTSVDMRKGFHGLEALVSQSGLDLMHKNEHTSS